ncbi:MAG: hypothetical protein PHY66_08260 [Aliarcobacter sp.]|nr:hypothetical protein [Aliarcobacter sp.]MDD2887783.1 hypothetical protein [Aliarcobacter sp.]
MKKFFINAIILIAVALSTTGCVQTLDNGVQIPGSSKVEENKATKLYYKDTNNEVIRENMRNLADLLNNNEIRPTNWQSTTSTSDASFYDTINLKRNPNTDNKKVDLKFTVDESTNTIVANKKYTSRNEAYLDLWNIREFLFDKAYNHTEVGDKIGTSFQIFPDEYALDKGELRIFTKREVVRRIYAEKVEDAFKKAGYTVVNKPEDADMTVYFQNTRDYFKSEVNQMKKDGKTIELGVLNADTSVNQINKMGTAMNASALAGSSSGTAVGVGLGVGLAASAISFLEDNNFILSTLKITDVKNNKSYLYSFTFTAIQNKNPITRSRHYIMHSSDFFLPQLRIINEDGFESKLLRPIK